MKAPRVAYGQLMSADEPRKVGCGQELSADEKVLGQELSSDEGSQGSL